MEWYAHWRITSSISVHRKHRVHGETVYSQFPHGQWSNYWRFRTSFFSNARAVFFLADDTFPLASALWRHITNKTDYMWSNLNSLDWSHILVSSIVNTTSLSANVILIKLNLSAITHGVKYFTKPLIIYSAVLTRDTL